MTATIGPCISADSHVTEPPGTYIDRIDPAYRDRAPRLHHHDVLGDVMLIDNGKSLVPFWLVAAAGRPTEEVRLDSDKRFEELWRGGWDPVARLADQDTDGVVAEVIYPSVGMLLCNHPDAEYQRACFNAYNLWIAEFCATAPERLIGLGQTALVTPEDGIRDLEEIKALGLKGVMLPGIPPQKDYDDPMYDELWDAIIDLGLPPSFHILTSKSDTPGADHVRGPKLNSFMSIVRGNQDIIGTLIFGAVFERHPDLQRRVRRGRRGLGAALDVPRRPRLRPSSQLADRGRAHAPPERVVRRQRVPHVPRRLGRVPHRAPHEHRPADVGERLPAQRRDVAEQPGAARRARACSSTSSRAQPHPARQRRRALRHHRLNPEP